VAKAKLDWDLAKIDLESYTDDKGEYQVELEKRRAAYEMAKKEEKEAEDNLAFTRDLIKKGLAPMEQERQLQLNLSGKQNSTKEKEADLHVFQTFTKKRKVTELKAKAEDAERNLERTKKSQAAATEKAVTDLQAAKTTAELEEQHLKRLRQQME